MFSKVIGSMNKVVNKVSDVVDDVVDDAKDVITGKKDDKKTSSHGSKDVWERRSDDEGGLFGALKTGVGKIAHGAKEIADGIDDIGDAAIDTGKKAVRQAGKEFKQGVEHAARPFLDTHQRLQEDVQKTIDVLQNTSPSELVDKGWEAIGLSKAEREEIKESFQETYDKVSNAVDDGVQLLADRGEEIVRDTIVDVIRTHSELEDVFDQILPSKEEVEDFIKQQISQTSTEAQELVARLEELGISGAEFGMDLLEQIDGGEIVESAIELAFAQLPNTDLIRTGIAFDAKLLELASEIPSLGQDLLDKAEQLTNSLQLLSPGSFSEDIKALKPGESQKLELGGGIERGLKGTFSYDVEFKRLDNGNLAVTLNPSLGVALGPDELAEAKGVIGIELEIKNDAAVDDVLRVLHANLYDLSQIDYDHLGDSVVCNKVALSSTGSADASAVLNEEGLLELTGGIKLSSSTEQGMTRIDGKMASYASASIKGELQATLAPGGPIKFNLPELSGGTVPFLDMTRELLAANGDENIQLFSQCLQEAGAKGSGSLKLESSLDFKTIQEVGKKRSFEVGVTVQGSVGDTSVKMEAKITVKDMARLAEVLGQSAEDIITLAKGGKLDLAGLAKKHPDLVPDVLQIDKKLEITESQTRGLEVSVKDVLSAKVNSVKGKTVTLADTSKDRNAFEKLSAEDVIRQVRELKDAKNVQPMNVLDRVYDTFGTMMKV